MSWRDVVGGGLALVLLLAGCRGPGGAGRSEVEPVAPAKSSSPEEPSVATAEPTEPPEAATLEARLDAHAVTTHGWLRRDLYTWTTPEQIDALRAGGPLLVATAATAGRATPFNRLLDVMAKERRPGHEVARALRDTPSLERRRYAWTSPFATVLGKGPRRYGEALVRVQLDPRAVIARLEPAAEPPWSFRDGEGREVSEDAILSEPERIGAVYHLRTEPGQSIPFREYVLCNEAMVARWSVGTEAIRDRVAQERRLMLDLASGPFAGDDGSMRRWPAWPQWLDPEPPPTLRSRWHRTLAFDNERYRPTAANLEAIAAALADYDPTGPALEGGQVEAAAGQASR